MRAKLVREPLHINNYEDQIYESLLTEGFKIEDIRNLVNKVKDKKELILNLISRFNKSNNLTVRKYIIGAIAVAYVVSFASKNNRWANNHDGLAKMASTELADASFLSPEDVIAYMEAATDYYGNQPRNVSDHEYLEDGEIKVNVGYKDASEFKLSEKGIKFIKNHEKLKLYGYDIHDGKITIGYGHAESKKRSKYKIGQIITKTLAEKLLVIDLKEKERDVHRIFRQWKRKKINVKITQNMYDALISMAFNMGTDGLRTTEFIQLLKKGEYKSASNIIETTRLKKGFSGLEDRRKDEAELFVSDM